MADRRRDDELITFKVIALFFKATQSLGQIGGHAWLFCDNQGFRHQDDASRTG